MRKVAIFDIDGTIFRSSLLIEITEELVARDVFKPDVKKIYKGAYKRWAERKGSYEDYIHGVIKAFEANIKGVPYVELYDIAEYVVSYHKNRVYRYTRDLVQDLKKKEYFMLAISNSPRPTVEHFCKQLGFDKIYGRVYEAGVDGKMTGETLHLDLISDKAKILKRAVRKNDLTLRGSIGVGDTESDIRFLERVENPICFNPNLQLYKRAKRSGWKVVVERKNMIYEFPQYPG